MAFEAMPGKQRSDVVTVINDAVHAVIRRRKVCGSQQAEKRQVDFRHGVDFHWDEPEFYDKTVGWAEFRDQFAVLYRTSTCSAWKMYLLVGVLAFVR